MDVRAVSRTTHRRYIALDQFHLFSIVELSVFYSFYMLGLTCSVLLLWRHLIVLLLWFLHLERYDPNLSSNCRRQKNCFLDLLLGVTVVVVAVVADGYLLGLPL